MKVSVSPTDYLQFVDAITREVFKITTGSDEHGMLSLDGYSYYVNIPTYNTATIVWGAGTTDNAITNPGTYISRFNCVNASLLNK